MNAYLNGSGCCDETGTQTRESWFEIQGAGSSGRDRVEKAAPATAPAATELKCGKAPNWLTAQYLTSRILSEASSIEQAGTQILRAVGESTGWEAGLLWLADPQAGVLRCAGFWHAPDLDAQDFLALASQATFALGQGLPGKVWNSREAAWSSGSGRESSATRDTWLTRSGFESTLAAPILTQHEVFGCLQFCSREFRTLDENVLELMAALGLQIGQFIEHKSKEEQLKRTQAFLNSVVQNLPIGVFIKDAKDLRFVLWNKGNEELIGYSESALLGKNDHDMFAKEEADLFVGKDRETLSGGKLVEVEEEIMTPHKGKVLLRTRKIPILNEAGKPAFLLGISEDITLRKQAEAELAYERDLLRTLLDNSPDHIYFKDSQSRFIRCSQALCKRCGVADSAEVIGKSDFDFFGEEHARPAFEDEQNIIRTGVPVIGRIEKEVWKQGQVSWVLTSKLPFHDKSGTIIGTFGISKDITAIKEAEAKLEEVHKQLLETSRMAGMAEVATGVLHNVGNVLNSVNVSATLVADRMKKSKVGNLSRVTSMIREHDADLGSFITADPKGRQLPAYLSQLAERLAAEQTASLQELDLLRLNIEHIKDIVAMQQSYARVSGVSETVKINELVEDALRLNAGALARHEVQLVREYADNLPEITIEKHKVLQILVNLIRNAKYACDESGRKDKRLTMRLSFSDNRICVGVGDNGVGIPAENLNRIFNHGFTTRKEGHGFGLHSGALAAKELGGSLRAHSAGPGQGAEFTLELPLTPVTHSTTVHLAKP